MSASRSARARRQMNRVVPYSESSVFRRNNSRCSYCGCKVIRGTHGGPRQATVDHVVPIFLGGEDTSDNVTTACQKCNTNKDSYTRMVDLAIVLWNMSHPLSDYPTPSEGKAARRARMLAQADPVPIKPRVVVPPPNKKELPEGREYWVFVVESPDGLREESFTLPMVNHTGSGVAWQTGRRFMKSTKDERRMLRCWPWRDDDIFNKARG